MNQEKQKMSQPQLSYMTDLVKEFHQVSGHPIGNTFNLDALTNRRAAERADYIKSEITEFLDANREGDVVATIDGMPDAVYFALGTLVEMGLNGELTYLLFREVHEANMTKFCTTEEEAMNSVLAYINGTHPQQGGEQYSPNYRKEGEYWIVYDVPTTKILKSIKTRKPDLQTIIDNYRIGLVGEDGK